MKTKILHIILAGMLGTAMTSQAAVLYQSDFTDPGATLASTGLAASAGAVGGTWTINTTADRLDGVGGGNARSNVYTTNAFSLDPGFKGFELNLTFQNTGGMTRFSMGLVDGDFNIGGTASDWFNQSLAGAYGVGFSTAGSGTSDYLGFNNDAGTITELSTAQGDATVGILQTMSISVTADSWSYSLNGQTATTGTFATEFDITRGFRFASYAQRNNRAQYTNITISAIPEPSSTALLGLGGLAMVLRRKRS
ncbi:MAG: PEP-CTERM sorting domain-containing protein [Akkermansiaceae bacterium]|nr:PEP-CTERM sorting domain-containing protein [Akkermansiaceae bacterium]